MKKHLRRKRLPVQCVAEAPSNKIFFVRKNCSTLTYLLLYSALEVEAAYGEAARRKYRQSGTAYTCVQPCSAVHTLTSQGGAFKKYSGGHTRIYIMSLTYAPHCIAHMPCSVMYTAILYHSACEKYTCTAVTRNTKGRGSVQYIYVLLRNY